MTVKEAAQLLEVSERTVYAMCQQGKLSHRRVGARDGAIRISRQAIDSYLAAHSFDAGARSVEAASGAKPKAKASGREAQNYSSRHIDWSKRRRRA